MISINILCRSEGKKEGATLIQYGALSYVSRISILHQCDNVCQPQCYSYLTERLLRVEDGLSHPDVSVHLLTLRPAYSIVF